MVPQETMDLVSLFLLSHIVILSGAAGRREALAAGCREPLCLAALLEPPAWLQRRKGPNSNLLAQSVTCVIAVLE